MSSEHIPPNLSRIPPIERMFYLPPQYVATYLAKYYILHWQGSHILAQIDKAQMPDGKTRILHQDVIYNLNLDLDLGKSQPINPFKQYKLSFRLEKYMYQGLVLIKEIKVAV